MSEHVCFPVKQLQRTETGMTFILSYEYKTGLFWQKCCPTPLVLNGIEWYNYIRSDVRKKNPATIASTREIMVL